MVKKEGKLCHKTLSFKSCWTAVLDSEVRMDVSSAQECAALRHSETSTIGGHEDSVS